MAENRVLLKLSKIVRVMTIAPLMAFVLINVLFFTNPASFGGLHNYLFAILFLVVLPVLGYPLQPLIPKFKDKAREGQRNLAIIMAVIGYVCGIIYAFIVKAPRVVWVIFVTYFLSGIGIVLFNKIVKVRASGHACGVAGPMAVYIFTAGIRGIVSAAVLVLVFLSSIYMKRHTFRQLVYGSIIPIVCLGLALLMTRPLI